MRDKGEIGVQMVLYKKKLCNVLNIFQGVKWDLLFVNRTKYKYDMQILICYNSHQNEVYSNTLFKLHYPSYVFLYLKKDHVIRY